MAWGFWHVVVEADTLTFAAMIMALLVLEVLGWRYCRHDILCSWWSGREDAVGA